MIAFLLPIAIALCVAVLVRRLTRDAPDRSDRVRTGKPGGGAPPAPPAPAGHDVPDTGTPVWTALDDHQLTRLLKDSSS